MGNIVNIGNTGTIANPSLVLPADLIAYYRFEEKEELAIALDWAMNFNTAVNAERVDGFVAQGLPVYRTGKTNFKGDILLNEIPSSQEITVDFWVKLSEELMTGEHRTYTLFSKKWVSGMQWYAYFVTRLESVQLHCCFSYLVADAENPSLQVKGATWESLGGNGLYYKQSAILYQHAENPDWRIFYDADVSKWFIQKKDGEVFVNHFESATAAGAYAATPFGRGAAVVAGVDEVSDVVSIDMPYVPANEWTRVFLPLRLAPDVPSGFGVYYGNYSGVKRTSQIVDIPVNTDIDPQLIGEQSQLMLCTNDPSIPYIIDGHPLPTSARFGVNGVIDEVKVWRSLQRSVPIAARPKLFVEVAGKGFVDVTPDKVDYDFNEAVELQATADEGETFIKWIEED